MAPKDYTTRQMVGISKRWLGTLRPQIDVIADVAGNVGLLQRAHQSLFDSIRPDLTPVSNLSAAISTEQAQCDRDFDRFTRGTIRGLQLQADFAETPEEEVFWETLLKALFPMLFDTTNQTYEEESGFSELLESQLTPEVEQKLKEIPLRAGRTLLEKVQELIKNGKRLGVLEDQKKEAQQPTGQPSEEGRQRQARLQWIRAVNAFISTLAIADAPQALKDQIMAPVRSVEAVVARRKRGEAITAEEEDQPAEEGVTTD